MTPFREQPPADSSPPATLNYASTSPQDFPVLKAPLWSLFRPGRLGRELPPFPEPTLAAIYSTGIRIVVGFAFFIGLTLPNSGKGAAAFLFAAVAFGTISYGCEVVIAALLTRFVEPTGVPPEERRLFWRTLCRWFSTFLLITVGLTGLATLAIAWKWGKTHPELFPCVWLGIPALSLAWWWHNLGRAIVARSQSSMGRKGVITVIPIIGAASVALGVAALGIAVGMLQ